MIDINEIKEFISTRIKAVENKSINENLENDNGLLLHFVPETLIEEKINKPIDWANSDHQFIIKHGFRKFSDLQTAYVDQTDRIEGYTPNSEFFNCFQNGIIEVYKSKVEIENQLGSEFNYVKVDNLFYAIRNFLEVSRVLHKKIYKTEPPYLIFISVLGITGTYFYSFDGRFQTTTPFPSKNLRFEPFNLLDLEQPIIKEIAAGINQGIRTAAQWNWKK